MFNKEDIKEVHIEQAYKFLSLYCQENNIDMLKFVKNPDNIPLASKEIHKQLSLALRVVLRPSKIEQLIIENHEFIIAKTKEQTQKHKQKAPKGAVKKSKNQN